MLVECKHSCGVCQADDRPPSVLHQRLSLIREYELGPLYLTLALLTGVFCEYGGEDNLSGGGATVRVAQVLAAGFVLPWTSLACCLAFALGGAKGGPLSLGAGGMASGICLFVGTLAVAESFRLL